MTILIANIGTSDLAIKIGEYHLPIKFNYGEPNLYEAIAELNDIEKAVWNTAKKTIDDFFNKDISAPKKTFREQTHYILEEYKKDPDTWYDLLRPGRLWGVMEKAIREEQVTAVYIFVTDQPEFDPPKFEGEAPRKNGGYPTDSINLFHILQRWFSREFGDTLKIIPVIIPKSIPAIDEDGLLNEYYKFFNRPEFDKSTTIRVSVHGGTQQMQAALRVQAISSDITTQIYLEPELSIKRLLAGKPSKCRKISYWRYQRTQKYQTIKQLLNRWDFDGARTILNQWRETLKTLETEGIEGTQDIKSSENRINAIVKALNMAVGYLNLDTEEAQKQTDPSLVEIATLPTNYENNKFSPLLNLYTQCCLFDNLDRMADFLTRMGSFYEETLHKLISPLGGIKYFDRQRHPDDWLLMTGFLLNDNNNLAQNFYQLEKQLDRSQLVYKISQNNCVNNGVWVRSVGGFKLPGRFTKRNFVEALLQLDNRNQELGQTILTAMKTLDYWFTKRNQLIHGAQGVSKLRMQEALEEDRQLVQDNQIDNEEEKEVIRNACNANQILPQMANIARSTLTLMGTTQPPSATGSNPADYLHPGKEPYYIYSDIRKWVIDTLNSDV